MIPLILFIAALLWILFWILRKSFGIALKILLIVLIAAGAWGLYQSLF